MHKIPFKKFIFVYLLRNRTIQQIIDKLNKFGCHISEEEVSSVFSELLFMLPESLKNKTENMIEFNISNEEDGELLKKIGIYKFFNFLDNRNDENKKENYFKWFDDCLWILNHEDTMSLINIFLFNEEPLESICTIIKYRYKKTITTDALGLYKEYFWDCNDMTAKEALYYCKPFRDNTLIVKTIASGADELEVSALSNDPETLTEEDGSSTNFVFHDSSYIKWKIGYKKLHVPDTKDFMEQIKRDSYFKYYEVMNMNRSIEVDEEDGMNDKIGSYNNKKIRRRNVEEQRVKNAKQWMDMFIKADSSIPTENESEDEKTFFEKMNGMELEFEEEKIMNISENQDMLNDVKGDM
jgi:hypothetical protein